jgi:hypothetical protein
MGGGPAACALVELAPLLCHCLGRSYLSQKNKKQLYTSKCCGFQTQSVVQQAKNDMSAGQGMLQRSALGSQPKAAQTLRMSFSNPAG